MDKKDVELAIERFLKGERPFSYRRPRWYLITESGMQVPLKYVYAMARGLESLNTHTDEAKKDLSELGYLFAELDGGEQGSINYWWVNHKQTYKAELEGGYIWSPTKNSDDSRNQTYINLTLVKPGDVVISYAYARIKAIGVATSSYEEQIKPEGLGQAGENWSDAGWLVPVEWTVLNHAISPKDHIADISKLLPEKHSPLQSNGNGNQKCYLARISPELGALVLGVATVTDNGIAERLSDLENQVECNEIQHEISVDTNIAPTEREQLVKSRVGQGVFRLHVLKVEKFCRLTRVRDERFLVASHIKPWRLCTNSERLDGHNGLMLAPHVDKLFDRGWITFRDDGTVLVADAAKSVVAAWGVDCETNTGEFTPRQREYLMFHRSNVFKGS
ncbi:HNH endonuclease [Pseudomonas putida]|uniref:HNH endonuclease n=1 Tax=Pseudomonas putida TaxID=303 RepID=UPI000A89C170|nr:HNH endonuclease [Pseudomonas putida]